MATTSSDNTTVQAVSVSEAGGPEKMTLVTYPLEEMRLESNDLLVRVSYAGVNFIDTYYRKGLYAKPGGYPLGVGEEGCGVVVDAGDAVNKEEWVGKRVAFYKNLTGSYATHARLDTREAFIVPDGVTDTDAAATLLQGCTAHYLTHDTYKVKEGDVVLVHAAAGGTGLLVSQLAKTLGASCVIGVCRGAEKAQVAKEVGRCDVVIDTQETPDWLAGVLKVIAPLGGRGCDVVYDGVGKDVFKDSLKCLARRGHMVTFGNASGPVDPIAPLELTRHGSITLSRPTLVDYMCLREEATTRVSAVFDYIAKGSLKLTVRKVFPLVEAANAHRYLEGRCSIGKILICCQK